AGRYEDLAELFADDIEFETPFAPADRAPRVVGRGPVTDALTRLSSTFEGFVFELDAMYPGADGETIVAEDHSSGTVKRNGKLYGNRYVGIFQVRDGAVARWREYYNPLVLTSAMS